MGRAIALDLSRDHNLMVADIDPGNLAAIHSLCRAETVQADLGDPDRVTELAQQADLVIGAVPGPMGYRTAEAVLRAGRNLVDISFFEEDPFGLARAAEKAGVRAAVDCGIAPGLDNMILGFHDAQMEVRSFRCLVGGLPKHPEPPFHYKAPFSPVDVIAEYTRPARVQRGGKAVVLPALSEPELFNMRNRVTLEAFLTDGLRTLLHTMAHIPHMEEKTLRYPGHRHQMEMLRDTGFFSEEETEVNGQKIRPIDLTAALLLPHWELKPGEEEFAVMRVEVEGTEGGRPVRYLYDIFDAYDRETGLSSMARTTGFTCAAVARLFLEGRAPGPGIIPPERLTAERDRFDFVLDYLKGKGIQIGCRKEEAED